MILECVWMIWGWAMETGTGGDGRGARGGGEPGGEPVVAGFVPRPEAFNGIVEDTSSSVDLFLESAGRL